MFEVYRETEEGLKYLGYFFNETNDSKGKVITIPGNVGFTVKPGDILIERKGQN